MNTKQKIFLILIVVVAAAAWYGFKQYNRKNKDLAHTKADIEISSSDLIKAFKANEYLSNAKYADKIIGVSGTVEEVNKDDNGYYTLVLGEDNGLSSVRCNMDTAHQQDITDVRTGNQIRVMGVCTGFNVDELLGSDVVLNRCVVANKFEY